MKTISECKIREFFNKNPNKKSIQIGNVTICKKFSSKYDRPMLHYVYDQDGAEGGAKSKDPTKKLQSIEDLIEKQKTTLSYEYENDDAELKDLIRLITSGSFDRLILTVNNIKMDKLLKVIGKKFDNIKQREIHTNFNEIIKAKGETVSKKITETVSLSSL
jgi:hypothetical protein